MITILKNKYSLLLLVALAICNINASAQKVFGSNTYQTFSSAGTTNGAASDGANLRLYSVVGQPMTVSNATLSQTQAGILSAVSNGIILFDNIPPDITPTLVGSFKDGDSFSFSVSDLVSVADAKIHFRAISASITKWDSTDLTSASISSTLKAYSPTVSNTPKTMHDAMGIEYYYTAKDGKGNYKRDPLIVTYYSYLTTPVTQFPASLLSAGIDKSNYRIIAMPFSSSGGDPITNVFGTNSGLPAITDNLGANWKLGTYDNTSGIGSVQAYPGNLTTFKRGIGYWFILRTPATINIGQVTAPQNNRASLFQLSLKDGWNMIGNPYPVDINWNDVQNLQGNPTVTSLKVWTGGWADGATLPAFQGGFVKNAGTSTVRIPFPGQTTEGGRVASSIISSNISGDRWKVELHIFQEDTFNKLGGFGMDQNSSSGIDVLDDYNPPSFLNSPEIDFDAFDPNEKMCQSIVRLESEFIWKFKPSGVIGKLTELTWSKDLGPGFEQLFLVDETQVRVIDMRQQNNYTFDLARDYRFRIYFGKDVLQKIAPEQLAVSPPYPNPVTQNQTTFNLGLPEVGTSYCVNIQIFNSSGIAVNNDLMHFEPGIHSVIWQPNENSSSGLYFYRITISSSNTNGVSTGKIILR